VWFYYVIIDLIFDVVNMLYYKVFVL